MHESQSFPELEKLLIADISPIGSRAAELEFTPLLTPFFVDGNIRRRTEKRRWARKALAIVHRMSVDPFTAQRDLQATLGLERGDLIRLNQALRRSPAAQALMVQKGHGAKYWQNTILPLGKSGVIDDALEGADRFPFRVGIYPGLACMFNCTFCGRKYDSRYGSQEFRPGNATFARLFEEAAGEDPFTFYLSGGLEPLTNPGIGKLITEGAARGFELSMYTNGFALSPKLLEKTPGIWDLSSLRFSLYGINERTAAEVTGRGGAFQTVFDNIVNLLRVRNEGRADLKIGLNYVLLPGKTHELDALIDLIRDINRSAGDGRGIDYLTLREDYSVSATDAVPQEERRRLGAGLRELRDNCHNQALRGLTVDLGYALSPLAKGALSGPLQRCSHRDLRPRAYPQISVVVDLRGDVYAYREAGFIERSGANRYILGNISRGESLRSILSRFASDQRQFSAKPGDTKFLDIFDHVVTKTLGQAERDKAFGIPFRQGPVVRWSRRGSRAEEPDTVLAHPTLPAR